MLYNYPSLGEDRADDKFLLRADEFFGFATGNREWVRRSFSWSFRLTPNMAMFLNMWWGRPDVIVGANSRVPNASIELIYSDPYKDESIIEHIMQCIKKYGREHVALIGHSTKPRTPISIITEKIEIPIYMKNENSSSDEKEFANKLHVLTACASKGAEYKVVFFIGFDVYSSNIFMSINQACVGISRASEKLYIVVNNSPKNKLYPIAGEITRMNESYAMLKQMHQNGIIATKDIPYEPIIPLEIKLKTTVNVTDMRINARDLLTMKEILCSTVVVTARQANKNKMSYKSCRNIGDAHWDVSDIYGIAIPFAFQASRGIPPQIIMNSIMATRYFQKNRNKLYCRSDVEKAARTDNFIVSGLAQWSGYESFETLRDLTAGCLYRGEVTIDLYEGPGFSGANRHLKDMREICMNGNGLVGARRSHIWLYLAMCCQALDGHYNRFKYIGTTPKHYDWKADTLFEEAVRVMKDEIPEDGQFERSLSFSAPGIQFKLVGVADWVDSLSALLYEFKFCADVSEQHRMQTCVYTAMLSLELGRTATGILFNVRSGHKETFVVTPESAQSVLPGLLRLMAQ
jgi:hypothetical protein